jgi:hypothetical protein
LTKAISIELHDRSAEIYGVEHHGRPTMKIISILRGLSTATDPVDHEQKTRWLRDPLAHPDLDAMSERQLADLPFGRAVHTGNAANFCFR